MYNYLKKIYNTLTGSVKSSLDDIKNAIDNSGSTYSYSSSIIHITSDDEPNGIFVKVITQIDNNGNIINDVVLNMDNTPYVGDLIPFSYTDAFNDPIV